MTPDELCQLADEIERGVTKDLERRFKQYCDHLPTQKMGHPLTNLQDAVDAVPEGWSWLVSNFTSAEIYPHGCDPFTEPHVGRAPNPAAALCAAILRAKAAEMESE